MKIKKEFIIKLIFLLISVVVLRLFLFNSVPSYQCMVESGEETWIDGLDINVCIIKTKDEGKYCRDNLECEGYCIVKDRNILDKKWIEIFGNETESVKINDFEEKAQIKIEGSCSEFREDSYCGDDNELFVVKNGFITKKPISPWLLPMIDCNSYFNY